MNSIAFSQKYHEIKGPFRFRKIAKNIFRVMHEKSFYPLLERKSWRQRLVENISWYFKHGEACKYYNVYGFDIVGLRNQDDYLPYRDFMNQRERDNFRNLDQIKYDNKVTVLRDKIVFASYFGTMLGEQFVIPTIAKIYRDGRVLFFEIMEVISFDELLKRVGKGNLFIKKLDGQCGDGCYLLNCEDSINKFVMEDLRGSEYLVQKQLVQHPDIDRINPSCVNTIRIVTIVGKNSHNPRVLAAFMRFGNGRINDNVATGGHGVCISIDGSLIGPGIGHKDALEEHPITHVRFEGHKIPFWEDVQKLVLRAHMCILDIPTIGWDVAITQNGPVLVEGNENWEIDGVQAVCGGVKERWYKLRGR